MTHEDKKLCERAIAYTEPCDGKPKHLVDEMREAIERLSAELEEAKVWPSVFAAKNTLDAALVMRNDQLVKELATLRAQLAEKEPVAWIVPGADCDCGGFIPCMAYKEGEFTQPLCLPPAEDAKDAEIQRLRKVMFDAWDDTDWLLIANEVHDMKGAK